MRAFLAACLAHDARGLRRQSEGSVRYRAARREAEQRPHATKLYRQIVEDHPDSPYANQAKTRLAELEKAR